MIKINLKAYVSRFQFCSCVKISIILFYPWQKLPTFFPWSNCCEENLICSTLICVYINACITSAIEFINNSCDTQICCFILLPQQVTFHKDIFRSWSKHAVCVCIDIKYLRNSLHKKSFSSPLACIKAFLFVFIPAYLFTFVRSFVKNAFEGTETAPFHILYMINSLLTASASVPYC